MPYAKAFQSKDNSTILVYQMTVSDPQLVKNRCISFISGIMVVGGSFTGHFKDTNMI